MRRVAFPYCESNRSLIRSKNVTDDRYVTYVSGEWGCRSNGESLSDSLFFHTFLFFLALVYEIIFPDVLEPDQDTPEKQ